VSKYAKDDIFIDTEYFITILLPFTRGVCCSVGDRITCDGNFRFASSDLEKQAPQRSIHALGETIIRYSIMNCQKLVLGISTHKTCICEEDCQYPPFRDITHGPAKLIAWALRREPIFLLRFLMATLF
jgi:hypothetical protein